MSRSDERKTALRFCLAAVGWLGCLFGWVCVLSFDVADPPADSVWPLNPDTANLCGPVGAWVAFHLFFYLGVGTYALLGLLTAAVIAHSKDARLSDPWLRMVGLTLICTAVSTWGAMLAAHSNEYLMSGPGGVLGTAAASFFVAHLETTGTHIVMACALVIGLLLAADDLVIRLFRWARWTGRRSIPVLTRGGSAMANAGVAVAQGVAGLSNRAGKNGNNGSLEGDREPEQKRESLAIPPRQLAFEPSAEDDRELMQEPDQVVLNQAQATEKELGLGDPNRPAVSEKITREPERKGSAGKKPKQIKMPSPGEDNYGLPALDLLEASPPIDKESIEILCREKAYILEQTLNEFRLEVQVVAIETGPVITVFELKLSPGIKVSQIASLTNDMARALKAPAVRVVAPLPGKNTIGIEVPNIDKEKVHIRDVVEQFGRRAEGQAIPLFLGKDASGQSLVSDLTRMPHLLIAGTTGSGKSVCISSVIMSILMTRSPSEVQLILIDPKVVELAMYKDVPHLMCPIVTEMPKAEAILDWAATKMDERYALFSEAGVKDIRAYNRLGRDGLKERLDIVGDEEMERIPTYLPYIVIIIDELADLMMTSAKEVEFYLCRLAQKSRAIGIHLIVSTQRPQANVVTGLIKSNLPCRIAFRVASRLDSRIVLDQNGGEVLMGQGDMLFLPPGSSKLLRAQGTFVADNELRRVVKHCREQCGPSFHPELIRMPGVDSASSTTERDELFDQAVDTVIVSGRGSVSLLQRRLTVGYGRASRLIDQMYAAGIVGEYKGSQAREVILSKEEWDALRNQRDREEAAEQAEFTME